MHNMLRGSAAFQYVTLVSRNFRSQVLQCSVFGAEATAT